MRYDPSFVDILNNCEDPEKMTAEQLYNHIMSAIEPNMPYLAYPGSQPVMVLENLDYGLATNYVTYKKPSVSSRWQHLEELPIWESKVFADVNTGGSEGVYLSVYLEETGAEDPHVYRLFTFKTLGEGPEAYALMGTLSGLVIYALELFFALKC